MSEKDLDSQFKEAFEIASNMEQDSLPQDIMLRLYAFYKQAEFGNIGSINYAANDVVDAFKLNAWMQVSHLSEDEAKKAYIDLIEEITRKK
ncbi:acyl-CoA-binding protein [Flavobacterium amniphilum]|uniref:acyl-CoA-binding protein n=1 Tax=Flavobacterium amniphilum TaxID=1834035 RepID=UPI00202A3BF0|nr:acyl-CoA-binding protein [Flavobacterium amniphilum]MCL9805541.1 acyl-CoA-binding protein [Flavobacterium amniphilum]